ncbi:PAS domain-containing protein [Streptomyces sp. NPDC003032]
MSSRPSRGAARLAAILDALPDALVLVNANGTVVNANAIALEAFETPGTALVGRGLLDLLPEFDSRLIPGSMRRPDTIDERGRTKPTRMTARRTDGTEFPVEVTSSPLEDGRTAYDNHGYTGDELLMLVVRDLSGTVDTEAELARSQRQTEMILRAAAEGVVGTDTDGRVVLVNPAAAQILGFRASDLGGQELHPLVLHSRADGEPFPYEESPLADTLRSGRKHRVRGQVLWSKSGAKVPVDLTTSPVRDGDQLVGAVMTFTDRRPYDELAEKHEAALARHAEELRAAAEQRAEEIKAAEEQRAEELAAEQERYAALAEREKDRFEELAEREKARYDALAARHEQLLAVLGSSLRGPLDELRRELAALAADDAGQLWPEANQVLHHLSAGYARMTTLVDNVLGFQRLDAGDEQLSLTTVPLDAVVATGVEGAVELIGPGRAQFAVHAPPIEVVVDAERLATAVAHLVADVAGIDATGNTRAGVGAGVGAAGGYVDSTIVVAAAQRGEVVRIEVRGPYAGGDPVHEPIVRGIVRAHGGVLQTHEVPGMSGSAYVLEVPIGAGSTESGGPGAGSTERAVSRAAAPAAGGSVVVPEQATATMGGGRRRARRPSVDSFLESGVPGATDSSGSSSGSSSGGTETGSSPAPTGTGRRRGRRATEATAAAAATAAPGSVDTLDTLGGGSEAEAGSSETVGGASGVTSGGASGGTGRRRGRPSAAEGAVVTAAEHAAGSAALGQTVPPQGVPVPADGTGRRARRAGEQHALPALASGPSETSSTTPGTELATPGTELATAGTELAAVDAAHGDAARPTGRRARRALAAAKERAAAEEANSGRVFALPPAMADRGTPGGTPGQDAAAPEAVSTVGHAVLNQRAVAVDRGVVDKGVAGAAAAGQGAVSPGGVGQGAAGQGGGSHAVAGQGAAGQGVVSPNGLGQTGVGQGAAGPGTAGQGVASAGGVGQTGVNQTGVRQETAGQGDVGRRVAAPGTAGQGVVSPGGLGQTGVDQAATGQGPVGHAVVNQDAVRQGSVNAGTPGGTYPAAQGDTGQHATAPHATTPHSSAPHATTPHSSAPHNAGEDHTPPQPHPAQAPTGRRRSRRPVTANPATPESPAATSTGPAAPRTPGVPPTPAAPSAPAVPGQGTPAQGTPVAPGAQQDRQSAEPGSQPGPLPAPQPWPDGTTPAGGVPAQGAPAPPGGSALPPERAAQARAAQPLPAEAAPGDPNSTQGRAFSVRTLGQGVPFGQQLTEQQKQQQGGPGGAPAPDQGNRPPGNVRTPQSSPQPSQPSRLPQAPLPPHAPTGPMPQDGAPEPQQAQAAAPQSQTLGGSGRRRRLATPPQPAGDERPENSARPHPQPQAHPQSRLGSASTTEGAGRSYAIGAPDKNADEGPEPLDGPGGAVEVANRPQPQPMDDELPPEPLDNPRRLLVWPAPDVTTQQALSDRGYRPVIVHSREEVDAQIAAFPAALFVDPLTGPITRTALQSLRQAAVAAEVPVLVTAGLGQATREAAYGADPAVLLKALAPRDSEQHPPRVLLIEEHEEIALALTATLERRGMQVARAASDADAVTLAAQMRPNLVVMDLLQVRRRRAGIIDWLRANGQLNRTPLVVYTAAVDETELPRLAAGETVLFLAERSTSTEVQSRIVDLLAKIGTN